MTYWPPGFRSARCGVRLPMRLKSSSVRSTRASWAMASRCSTALVEPPHALTAAIAFSNAALVMIWRGVMPFSSRLTTASPERRAHSMRSSEVAGADDEPGSAMPSASAAVAMVLAVNMPPHEPAPGQACCSISVSSATVMEPRATAPTASKTSWMLRSRPRRRPGMIVPP